MQTMTNPIVSNYRYWRAHGHAASDALSFARFECARRTMLDSFGDWTFRDAGDGSFAHSDLKDAPEGYTVRVLVGDDDLDWGDIEPTDDERDNASAYYVSVQVLSGGEEMYHDGVGGIDVIDLDGYLHRDWLDAVAYALIDCELFDGAMYYIRHEAAERDYWAARDVVSV